MKAQSSLPDYQWKPLPFSYTPGHTQRYIDYEKGDDQNPGTKLKPWKHHPWDTAASGNSKASSGPLSYVFKKGVTYRGQLIAKNSGEKHRPLRLTVDPEWGEGEAEILASMQVDKKWKTYNDEGMLLFPESSSGKIWFVDLDISFIPKLLWAIEDGEVTRIPVAREPDWQIVNQDDPKSEWWEWSDHIYTGTLSVESAENFSIGERIWILEGDENFAAQYIRFEADKILYDRDNSAMIIIDIDKNKLQVECSDYVTFKVENKNITNGSAITRAISDIGQRGHRLIDTVNLKKVHPEYYEGARVWTEQLSYAGYGHPGTIEQYSHEEQSIVLSPLVPWLEGQKRSPSRYCRYFLENKSQFLDSEGEFYFTEQDEQCRLFLRLPGDEDPNNVRIEIAKYPTIIEIREQDNIHISGLSFRFENIDDWLASSEKVAAIQLLGNCSDITISHCKFEHVIKALAYYPLNDGDVGDHIVLSDSDIKHTDHNAVALRYGLSGVWGFNKRDNSKPLGRLKHVSILRNNLYDIGHRPSPGEGCHAIEVKGGELVEIAYNIVDRTYASGIQALNNRWSGGSHGATGHKLRTWESPLNRCLVHHNKVSNTMLQGNDWGGIASWGIGPSYVYNNISGNCMGYRHSFYREGWPENHEFNSFFSLSNKNFGTAIYFDNQHKGYCFNNISWGKNNDIHDRYYNTYGYFQTQGILNHIFQNTFYNFAVGTMVFEKNFRCMGNLFLETGFSHVIHSAPVMNSTAYTNNAFYGEVEHFVYGSGNKPLNGPTDWQHFLDQHDPLAFGGGFELTGPNVQNAGEHDFRLKKNAPGTDMGVKVFVPWGLYKVVGEWHFYKNRANISCIVDEHLYLNDEYVTVQMFTQIPRHDLIAYNAEAKDFHSGPLEDWVEGALYFNGNGQYCSISDSSTKASYEWKTAKESGRYPGEKRVSLDTHANNFLIEAIFKLDSTGAEGAMVSKGTEKLGYHLIINEEGQIEFRMASGENRYTATTETTIDNKKWYHVLTEVNRQNEKVKIYIDGESCALNEQGGITVSASLTNQDDFTVGRYSTIDEGYFHGSFDFLRLSLGTLADAETSIEEHYNWQFDGPFLRDFNGKKPVGKGRDVGAVESNYKVK